MLKTAVVSLLVLGSVSVADAMPTSPIAPSATPQIVKAAIIVKKVVRRAPVMRRTVVRKTVIRR